jgi:hypothetical protein
MGKLLTRRRFTVDEYHRMGETGILPEDSRIEILSVRRRLTRTLRTGGGPSRGNRLRDNALWPEV